LDGFSLSTTRYHSYNHSLYSGSQNNYVGIAELGSAVDVEEGDTLSFYTWYDIENGYDYAYVEASIDGGLTYVPIAGNITTNYNPHGGNLGNGITGSSNSWTEAKFPLNAFVDMSVMLRFTYRTDGWSLGNGFYVDDIYPVEGFATEEVLSSDIPVNHYLIEDHANGTYFYQVRAIDAQDQWSGFSNREMATVEVVSVDDEPARPVKFNLKQNYPNPFNSKTEINFALTAPGRVRLDVFDVGGRLISTLVDGDLNAGSHSVVWDGRNSRGDNVASGLYFYRLTSDSDIATRKMTLLK
jgi:hypothetical protein